MDSQDKVVLALLKSGLGDLIIDTAVSEPDFRLIVMEIVAHIVKKRVGFFSSDKIFLVLFFNPRQALSTFQGYYSCFWGREEDRGRRYRSCAVRKL